MSPGTPRVAAHDVSIRVNDAQYAWLTSGGLAAGSVVKELVRQWMGRAT